MLINEQLEKLNITKYRLSKDSGVPQATINDICSGKAELEKCAAGTLFGGGKDFIRECRKGIDLPVSILNISLL